MDVSRALLLPDLTVPDAFVLKTSALYWEQVIVVDYAERLGDDALDRGMGLRDDDLARLNDEGIVVFAKRTAAMPQVTLPEPFDALPAELMRPSIQRLLASFLPLHEDITGLQELEEAHGREHGKERAELTDKLIAEAGSMAAELYLNRLQDAFEFARDHHLAPVGHSVLSHVGSLVGRADREALDREASLLAATIEGFEVSADTPVERICAFRDRHKHLTGRFRASLVDLSASLQQDAPPTARLAGARDVYRNRVVPSLGDLETAMRESRLTFVMRSLVGAAALTLGPVRPVTAAEHGAQLIGRTINYRFSRERLVQEHPYGYLYKVRQEFKTASRPHEQDMLADAMTQPVEFLRRALGQRHLFEHVTRQFWFTQQTLSENASASDAQERSELPGGEQT